MKNLFRATRDGFENSAFHLRCGNKGPLLIIIKTQTGLLIGGLTSMSWNDSDTWIVDPKCVLFSISRQKLYKRLDNGYSDLCCSKSYGPYLGSAGLIIN